MNNKAMTLALAIAAFATYLVWSWVSDVQEKARKSNGSDVLVLKAKVDIREAEDLKESMWKWEPVPEKFKDPSAITATGVREDDEEQLQKLSNSIRVAGYVALVPIKAGEQITWNKVSEPGIRTGLGSQVSPGKRAVAVAVNDVSSVSRLIKPGDRVDVIAVLDFGSRQSKVSKTLLQDVVVLSVGKNVTNQLSREAQLEGSKVSYRSLAENSNYSSVTLEVDPSAVQQLLLLGDSGGSIFLSLRNNDDTERVNLPPARMGDLVPPDFRAPAAAPLPGGFR